MFGQDTLYGNSMNGIRIISDGITNISNGEITATNINTDQINTTHISSGTGEFDDFMIGSVSATSVNTHDISANSITTDTIDTQTLTGDTLTAVTMKTHNGNMELESNRIKMYNSSVSTTNVRMQLGLDYIRIRDDFGTLKSSMHVNGSVNANQYIFMDASGNDVETFTLSKYQNLARLNSSNTFTGATNAFVDISAASIHLNGVDLQTTIDEINDTHEGHDHDGIYAELAGGNTMSGNQTITGIVDISGGTVSRGQTVLIPTQYRVDGVLTSYPNFNANYFPYGDGNFSNLLCADTTVGGNLTSLYDVAALRNMSAGGTIFVNNISNNSTALGVTSLPGVLVNTGSNALDLSGNLIIRGTTTVNGNVLVNGKTISPIEFGYLDGVTANIQAQLNAIRPLRYIRASTSMFNGEFLGLTLNFGLKSTWLVNDFVSLRIAMSSNFFNSPGEFPTITQSNNFYSWVIYMSVYPNRSPPNANRVLPNTAPNTLNHWIHGWHSEKHTYSTSPDYNTMFVSHPDFAGINAGFTTWFARRASQPSDYNSVNLTIEVLNDWRTPSNISYTADPGWISVQSY